MTFLTRSQIDELSRLTAFGDVNITIFVKDVDDSRSECALIEHIGGKMRLMEGERQ